MTVWKSTPVTIMVLSLSRLLATNVPPTPSCSARIFKTLYGSKNTGTNTRRSTVSPKLPCPLPCPPLQRGVRGDLPGVHMSSLEAVLVYHVLSLKTLMHQKDLLTICSL